MTTISNMTYKGIIMLVLDEAGVDITLDGTGMAFIAVDKEGTKIAGDSDNLRVIIYDVLHKLLVDKEDK